jgi:hypothetical protein
MELNYKLIALTQLQNMASMTKHFATKPQG